jgi:hypothetical protein
MPTTFLTLSPKALHVLRASLERDHGLETAAYLQEAGFAAGEDCFAVFEGWLWDTRAIKPVELDAAYLGNVTSEFFTNQGWGALDMSQVSPGVLGLASPDWAEAAPTVGARYPSCHFTSGLLADFFGRLAGDTVAVMEVECRTRGDEHCRFLVGSPDMLATVYERMSEGLNYAEASQAI